MNTNSMMNSQADGVLWMPHVIEVIESVPESCKSGKSYDSVESGGSLKNKVGSYMSKREHNRRLKRRQGSTLLRRDEFIRDLEDLEELAVLNGALKDQVSDEASFEEGPPRHYGELDYNETPATERENFRSWSSVSSVSEAMSMDLGSGQLSRPNMESIATNEEMCTTQHALQDHEFGSRPRILGEKVAVLVRVYEPEE
mmetsp:Transcript_13288/g.35729  ORF Transcript_13288/g.35729 Transcript_13288/m.35729 type:complete len:199 (+) Transcript_13288:753-1349(+)